MVNITPQIETSRLALKVVRIDDAADIYAYVRNPNVLRYTTGTTPREFAETEVFVRGLVDKPAGVFAWAIRRKVHSAVIGVVEFGTEDNGARGSVDYALSEEYWNQGIMTEAVRAVLDWAFQTLPGLNSVSSSAMTENPASTRVQEKCGMQFVRHEHRKLEKFAKPVEQAVCMVTREEWISKVGMSTDVKLVNIAELRPNNWFLNKARVDAVREAWQRGEQDRLPPVCVTWIDGQLSLVDGHARTYVAFENGASEIPAEMVPLEDIEGMQALYEHIHREGPNMGILSIGDLAGRILEPEEHRVRWVGYCTEWIERHSPGSD